MLCRIQVSIRSSGRTFQFRVVRSMPSRCFHFSHSPYGHHNSVILPGPLA